MFARLARDAERRETVLDAPAWSRWLGLALVVATLGAVLVTAVVIQPWG